MYLVKCKRGESILRHTQRAVVTNLSEYLRGCVNLVHSNRMPHARRGGGGVFCYHYRITRKDQAEGGKSGEKS